MRPGFALPDWNAPLDVDSVYAAIPADITVRGMFFQVLLEQARARGVTIPGRDRWVGFKSYRIEESIRYLVDAARVLHPRVSLREALRRVGHTAYPTLASSMIGRVVFGVLGNDVVSVLKLASKGYQLSVSHGRAEVLEITESTALVRLVDIWSFPDCYQVGVMEGVLEHLGRRHEVTVRPLGMSEAMLDLRWW